MMATEMVTKCLTKSKRVYCPHCDEYVARSLYYLHKQLYFDCNRETWKRSVTIEGSDKLKRGFTINFEFSPLPQQQEGNEPLNESIEDNYSKYMILN